MDQDDENQIPTLTLPDNDNSIDLSNLSTTITIDCSNWANSCITSGSTGYSSYYSGATSYPSVSWGNVSNVSTYQTNSNVTLDSNGITLKQGTDIKIGDQSLLAMIENIEARLGILHPNPELEDRWEELKAVRQRYLELEKELLEKEKMWAILKKT